MNTSESEYALEPATFHSMQEAQELASTLEEDLHDQAMGNPSIRPGLVEIFSQLVNNAAEHGMTPEGAHVTPTSGTCPTGGAAPSTPS